MSKREMQKQERMNQILDIALDLFVKKGFDATKITDIAKTAGISKGLMFNYFSSKEELHETLVRSGIEKSKDLLDRKANNSLDFFAHAANVIINGAKQSPTVAKMFVLMNDAARSEFLPADLRNNIRRNNILHSRDIVEEGQRQGIIRRGDAEAIASTFWAAILGVCQLAVQNEDFIFPEPEWILSIVKCEGLK